MRILLALLILLSSCSARSVPVDPPDPQSSIFNDVPMTPASGMSVDQHGRFHAGSEAEYPTSSYVHGLTNRSIIIGEIPPGYTEFQFNTFSIVLRPPKPTAQEFWKSAGLFFVYLATGKDEAQWGQRVANPILRAFKEPQTEMLPPFTANLYGAKYFVIVFFEVSAKHTLDNPSNMEIQITGQFK